jgi:hypothetical protein
VEIHVSKAVADLNGDIGYRHVVGELEKELEALQYQMESCTNSAEDLSLMAKWKAWRVALRRLKEIPQQHAESLERYLDEHPELHGPLTRGAKPDITYS